MDDDLDDRTEAAGPGFPGVQKREALPWVLFIATLVLFMISTVVLVNRSNGNATALNVAAAEQIKAQTQERLAKAELVPLQEKVAQLEAQLKTASGEREALAEKVKTLEQKANAPPVAVAKKKPVVAAKKKKKKK